MKTYKLKNGTEITLMQAAYLAGTEEQSYYCASAQDEEGTWYEVRWQILADYDPAEGDEGDACDWYNPSSIELY